MERSIYSQLLQWKDLEDRKPLILLGARQVGKTYILKDFGKREFKSLVYINCHANEFMTNLFNDFDTDRILYQLSIRERQKIIPGETLLILDEIQEIRNGIASLKYFCENIPQLHVAVAGSLLGITLREGESYPVGKVNTLRMYPMTYLEFLRAAGRQQLGDAIESLDYDLMSAMNDVCTDLLRQYYFTGGMPEAVKKWLNTHDPEAVRKIQGEIIDAYSRDFSKHAKTLAQRIHMVWESIPAQLAKENKKFIFGMVKKGARAAQFEEALQWLVDAGIAIRVHRTSLPQKPLKFYADHSAYKIYLLDCGLLAALCNAEPQEILLGNKAFEEFKGAFTENYVLQQITALDRLPVYYYSKDNSTMEVDFLVQAPGRIIPTEVKAEANVKSKSLTTFVNREFADHHLKGLRCSMKSYTAQDWMENIPLYAVESYFWHESTTS